MTDIDEPIDPPEPRPHHQHAYAESFAPSPFGTSFRRYICACGAFLDRPAWTIAPRETQTGESV